MKAAIASMVILLAACGDDDGAGTTDGGRDAAMPSDSGGLDAGARDGGSVDGGPIADGGTDAGPVDAGPPPDPLDGAGTPELVQGGFTFLEGPQWRVAEGDLLFTDIPANTIHRLDSDGTVTDFRTPSQNTNGLEIDPMGRVLMAEHSGRQVTRTTDGTTIDPVASTYMGDRFNSPNDLVARSDGTIYFTDPPYGLMGPREIDFNGVFRVEPDGTVHAEWEGALSSRPNGIGLSPDESVLYMADTASGDITAWDVAEDGSLSGERLFASTAGGPDGMAIDVWGNVWVTSSDGVEVFAPDGSRWGNIDFPMQPANCAFGGADLMTLYVTARTALYRVSVPVVGIP